MSPEALRQMLWAVPFHPLRLHLSNGTEFEVRSPEQAIVGRSVVILDLPWQFYGERRAVIGMRQILWIEEVLLPA